MHANALVTATIPHGLANTAGLTVDRNPCAVYLAKLRSEVSRQQRTYHLAAAARLFGFEVDGATLEERRLQLCEIPWHHMRYQHIAALSSQLAQTHAAASANTIVAAVRGVLREAWRLGLLTADDYMRAKDVEAVPNDQPDAAAGRQVEESELTAMVWACAADPSPAGTRDAAIIGLMAFVGGLRRAEVVALQIGDYDDKTDQLTITGKRRKVRTAYATNGVATALGDWVRLRGNEAGPLFCPVNKSGRIIHGWRMTPQAIYLMLQKRAQEAGCADFTPHDLRRTFIGNLLDAGVDTITVSKIVGHSSPTTTARYDRRGERAKMAAGRKIHFPYRSRF